jgi:hypothetical protein
MRVLACGSRGWTDENIVRNALSAFGPGDVLIHGCARGADTLAGNIGRGYGMVVEEYPADWKNLGRRAGPIRNERMLREGKPDVGLAFDLGTPGTADMAEWFSTPRPTKGSATMSTNRYLAMAQLLEKELSARNLLKLRDLLDEDLDNNLLNELDKIVYRRRPDLCVGDGRGNKCRKE